MSNSNDFLQDYLDSLLNDTPLNSGANRIVDEQAHVDENALKLASGSNIAPLTSASRPARVASARPYAEPIRTLNLRMPLPPVATEISKPAVETKQVVENKIALDVDAKTTVETQPSVAETVVETKPVVEAKPVVETKVAVEAKVAAETKPVAKAPPIVETPSIVETKTVVEPAVEATSLDVPSQTQTNTDLSTMAPPAAWLSNGRPQWAQQPFECLIFKAGGLQLAAPLVELGSIYPLEEGALTEIFGQTQWFMGLLPIKEYNIRAMDTGLVVMPERYSAAMREQYRYVVSLFGSDWGLAVDAVVGTTLLDPDKVRWRGERSKRPWLAGTLVDQMCALFDIAQLAWLFHSQDKKRAPK